MFARIQDSTARAGVVNFSNPDRVRDQLVLSLISALLESPHVAGLHQCKLSAVADPVFGLMWLSDSICPATADWSDETRTSTGILPTALGHSV
ncbi:hypothetical protein BASA60_001136 [Batrachochytrium salamandrivorans]|nr:hypothetical protein BASA60_001136 [Batrachochytrium salamandrivorans]